MNQSTPRWGIEITEKNKKPYLTGMQFDPDTEETARLYGKRGVERGIFTAFRVIDRKKKEGQTMLLGFE